MTRGISTGIVIFILLVLQFTIFQSAERPLMAQTQTPPSPTPTSSPPPSSVANPYFPAVVGAAWDFEWREWPPDRRGKQTSSIVSAESTSEGVRVTSRDETPDGTVTTRFVVTGKGVFREEVVLPKGRLVLPGRDLILPSPPVPGFAWETSFRLESPRLTEVARESKQVAGAVVPFATPAAIFTDCVRVVATSITEPNKATRTTTLMETYWCARVGLVASRRVTTDGAYSFDMFLMRYNIPAGER